MTVQPLFRITPGRWADYLALSHHHYRAGPPATHTFILAARDGRTDDLAGVLVVSMPALNAPWRRAAWGERYTPRGRGRRAAIARLNAEVRTISRVIVEPRYRALGVATALVRAYLIRPGTARTEALSAMGAYCPLFERAGMRPLALPRSRRDARFARALAPTAPWRLVDLAYAHSRRSPSLRRAARTWANDSKATRRHAARPAGELLALAASSLCARPVAYVCG
ncbi:hypothetical protein PHYC_01764 [Phycisphaerales bacterium]|nr:hypothetical protein PHYC_01764 [Phycisphaerales bacterium]